MMTLVTKQIQDAILYDAIEYEFSKWKDAVRLYYATNGAEGEHSIRERMNKLLEMGALFENLVDEEFKIRDEMAGR